MSSKYRVTKDVNHGATIERYVQTLNPNAPIQVMRLMEDADVRQVANDLAEIYVDPNIIWEYTFGIWPANGTTFSKDLYKVLEVMPLVTMEFTEARFAKFVQNLKLDGFELHEVTRVPYNKPVPVILP